MVKTIVFDMDDTLFDLIPAWCAWLNKKYGLAVKPKEITDWDICKFFPSLTQKQVFSPLEKASFWQTVQPKPYAARVLKALLKDGFDVYLCTATHYKNVQEKYEILIRPYLPFITWDKIIVMKNKQMLKTDILIDDNPKNLEGGAYYKILFTASHNKDYDTDKHYMNRANSLNEVKDIIYLLAGKR